MKGANWTAAATERLTELVRRGTPLDVIVKILVSEKLRPDADARTVRRKCERLGIKAPHQSRHTTIAPPRVTCVAIDMTAPESLRVPLMQLTTNTCRWRTNDTVPYEFCGNPTTRPGEKPYCDYHSRVAYSGLSDGVAFERWKRGELNFGRR